MWVEDSCQWCISVLPGHLRVLLFYEKQSGYVDDQSCISQFVSVKYLSLSLISKSAQRENNSLSWLTKP